MAGELGEPLLCKSLAALRTVAAFKTRINGLIDTRNLRRVAICNAKHGLFELDPHRQAHGVVTSGVVKRDYTEVLLVRDMNSAHVQTTSCV
jgi:hypothetical protein